MNGVTGNNARRGDFHVGTAGEVGGVDRFRVGVLVDGAVKDLNFVDARRVAGVPSGDRNANLFRGRFFKRDLVGAAGGDEENVGVGSRVGGENRRRNGKGKRDDKGRRRG